MRQSFAWYVPAKFPWLLLQWRRIASRRDSWETNGQSWKQVHMMVSTRIVIRRIAVWKFPSTSLTLFTTLMLQPMILRQFLFDFIFIDETTEKGSFLPETKLLLSKSFAAKCILKFIDRSYNKNYRIAKSRSRYTQLKIMREQGWHFLVTFIILIIPLEQIKIMNLRSSYWIASLLSFR